MTGLDATTHLFEWCKTHDCFEEKNIKEIILVSDTPDRDKAAFLCSLDDLEKSDVLGCTTVGVGSDARKIWVLKKNIQAYDQTVDIPYPLSLEISMCLNQMCMVLEDYTDQCDPQALTQKDIMNLTFICKTLQNQPPPENNLTSL